jgi:N-acetylmuramate 1-kinase
MQPQSDVRKQELEQWVGEQVGAKVIGEPASADASFRRYFRFDLGDRTLIGMDAPPEQEDCRPFVQVASLFGDAGVHVPQVVAQDLDRGYLLLSDMGTQTWLTQINADNADTFFNKAMDALVKIQCASQADVLPVYDEALLRRELELFPEWFLKTHLDLEISAEQRTQLDQVFDLLVKRALGQGRVYVHRDFMPRNLMDSEPNPGVIDFQDAVYGPISYDAICLFKDAFLSWPEDRVLIWLEQYWEKARAARLPVPASFPEFLHDCDLMGAQRHLKVIGIFARIKHRDGKGHYLEDVPRFFAYLRAVIARRPELAVLGEILDSLPNTDN